MPPIEAVAGAVRPLVHLPTHAAVGWSIDRAPSDSPDWLQILLAEIAAREAESSRDQRPRARSLMVIPWNVATGRALQLASEELAHAGAAGLMVRLPSQADPAEFELAVHRVRSAGVAAVVNFDGDVATIASLHQQGVLGAVRLPGVRWLLDGTPAVSSRLGRQMIRILEEAGVAVIVDGIEDDLTCTRLRQAGVRFGQGPVFDASIPSAPVLTEVLAGGVPAPVPVHEGDRIVMVHDADVINAAADPTLDAIVRLASERCGTVAAAVSIIDVERQHFIASVGLETTHTARRDAICAHAILRDEPLVIEDVAADARFTRNPLVIGPPHIGSYLGVPLRASNGLAFGALCVIDDHPRSFSASQISELRVLAQLVTDRLELRAQAARR
jgi:hypothetical protein